ncbi:MAG: hypothetical protein DUD27_03370 [Lachnospiraceae bacterium]|uniref:Uncharacterized protein n=1 Tax=Candidatus Weimeria bifida TaxID=2599074 RepID=A0A6N7IZ31_9FIRM|nr:hypothetical protein [Candidatus Weimeria bifida]RRF96660.1 MAG: hypothetical protein DUD27_03370 [Lachnospiraceae bacterium]
MTDKQALLKDLKVIAVLDQKIDYSDRDNIGAVLQLNPKALFSTVYGERYIERLRQMYNRENYEHTCILCGSPLEGDNPVCRDCYKMITLGTATAPKKPQPVGAETEASGKQTAGADEQGKTGSADASKEAGSSDTKANASYTKAAAETKKSEAKAKKPGKKKHLGFFKSLFLLCVILCASIAAAGGVILTVRDTHIKDQDAEVRLLTIKDADLRDYYSIIYTNTGYSVSAEDDS